MINWRIKTEEDCFDREELIEFLSKSFGPDYHSARDYKTKLFAAESSFKPENIITVRGKDHRLLGVLRIVERDILVDSIPLRTGFITSVAVHPQERGKGLGANIVQYALKQMKNRSFDLAAVHGRRAVDGFYPKFGFVHVGRYLDLEIISHVNSSEEIEVMPISREDIPMLIRYYQETYHGLTGSIYRDEIIWRFLFAKVENSGGICRLLRLQLDNDSVGYIATMGEDVIEAAVAETYVPLLPGVLKRLGLKRMRLNPSHPLFIHSRRHYSTLLQERFALDGGYMARLLNPKSVLQKLSTRLTDRATTCATPALKLFLFGHEVDLVTGSVGESSCEADIYFGNEDYAVQMVLGFQSLPQIPGACVKGEDALPRRLFPALGFHSAALDEV